MNRECEGLVRSQADLFGRISRAFENLKKTSQSKTLGTVEARLQALEAWSKFESQHDQLLSVPEEAAKELDYFKQDIPSLTEKAFLQ